MYTILWPWLSVYICKYLWHASLPSRGKPQALNGTTPKTSWYSAPEMSFKLKNFSVIRMTFHEVKYLISVQSVNFEIHLSHQRVSDQCWVWIINYSDIKSWNAITHPCPNFNSGLGKPLQLFGYQWLSTSHWKQRNMVTYPWLGKISWKKYWGPFY